MGHYYANIITVKAFRKLPIYLRNRVELSNLAVELSLCAWYEFRKKKQIKNNIDLIVDTYNIKLLYYLTT